MRLAIATADRYIILYDENGEQKDKFSTKPSEKVPNAPRNYIVRAIEFSPDSTRLAVAQSDNIVFVYKLGLAWGDKKTICNKIPQNSPITAMCWPHQRFNHVVFGLADGKVRMADLKSNKAVPLYNTDAYVVAMCASPDGNSFVSGHLDGSIYRYSFPTDTEAPTQAMIVITPFVPYALGWGEMICAAGNSSLVQFYDLAGTRTQQFDFSNDEKYNHKEFSAAAVSPSGHTIVLGSFDRFVVYTYNPVKEVWEEATSTQVENLYSVTALRWKSDGSRLMTGSLCGAVDMYDACIRRFVYGNKYEFTYTSPSSVIVKKIATGTKMPVRSKFNRDITKINIYQDRFLVANTPETLILGDVKENLLSEIPWSGSGQEKYFFDNPNACMVYNAGELSIIEYGKSEVLGSCRTEHMSHHLISVRINEARKGSEPVKKIAYLLDLQTVRVLDLTTGSAECTINHDIRIDWLELNQRAGKLLFRDKKRALHLYDIAGQTRSTLLGYCNYVQWVPDSDVVVAQSRKNLCVWYSIDHPEEFKITPIKGDIEEIQRTQGRTEVTVDEGINQATYPLDEDLISFGSAVDNLDFKKAVSILESIKTPTASSDAMWSALSKLALDSAEYIIAERCFAAVGDVSKAKLLHEINRIIQEQGNTPQAKQHYLVRALVSILNKQFKRAEAIFTQQGQADYAINMYKQMHQWSEALTVAESKNHPSGPKLRQDFYTYLLATKQEEVAGELKEKEGDYQTALQLYLKGGFPAKAADLVLSQNITQDNNLCETVAESLLKAKAYEKAGEFLESLQLHKRALEAYCKGHAYFKAVELARKAFPAQVVRLEEDWGDFLVSQKQMDAASNHYIQAGAHMKAINAAIEAKQWSKAISILENVDVTSAKPYFKRIAQHFVEVKKYEEAETYFIQAGQPQDAVNMYTAAGLWDKAHKIAVTYMSEAEVSALYINRAQLLESQGKFKEAERLYLTVKEPDLAINMYKKNRQYDQMIRLVTEHRKDLLIETHLHLAHQFETEGNFKLAEQHYIKAKEWKPAVSMYREHDMWEDCLRVAKTHGGQSAYIQVAYAWAKVLGGEAGVKMLAKRNLSDQAVDYAIERGEFTEAFHIAEKNCKHKLQEIHLQYAMALEDDGRFERAEEEFIKAKKPKEAIEMYLHQREWDHAMRVAEQHDPGSLADIFEAQGKYQLEQKNFSAAENMFIQAKKPELAVKIYKDQQQWDEAVRVAKTHAPHLVPQIQQEKVQHLASSGAAETLEFLAAQAKMFVGNKQYSRAVDTYLKVGKEHTQEVEMLEQMWESAASICYEYVQPRLTEVVTTVARRLIELERIDTAADILVNYDMHKEAIDTYMQAHMYDKARQLAQSNAPDLITYVDKAHQEHLIAHDQLGDLDRVNPDMAVEMYAKRGEWTKVLELAKKQGPQMLQKYALAYASALCRDMNFKTALGVVTKHGAPLASSALTIYEKIALGLFSNTDDSKMDGDTYLQLRDLMFKVFGELQRSDPNGTKTKDFERMAWLAHLLSLRQVCIKTALPAQAAKIAVSMLRYVKEVPADKAFHDAGSACLDMGWTNPAFVFLNRFIDLCDCIDEPESGDIDNSDFLITDIPSPYETPQPTKHSFSERRREEIREWVLEKAVDTKLTQSLNTRPCEKCGKDTYDAALRCHNCKADSEPCVVTGFPVHKTRRVKCKSCAKVANTDDWNQYVSKLKSCPWCTSSQNPVY